MADIQNNSTTLSVLLIQYNSSIEAIFGNSNKEPETVTCLFIYCNFKQFCDYFHRIDFYKQFVISVTNSVQNINDCWKHRVTNPVVPVLSCPVAALTERFWSNHITLLMHDIV